MIEATSGILTPVILPKKVDRGQADVSSIGLRLPMAQ
jgi:hypothetical protein